MAEQNNIELIEQTLHVRGDILLADVRKMTDQAIALIKEKNSDITVDLKDLGKYDNSICLLLVACFRVLNKENKKMACINIAESLMNIFKIYDLDEVLPFIGEDNG